MSHKAVSWALDQRHLKPAPWIVLIQLADRLNKDTLRCDPDQAKLAGDCNMSRATVNRHLEALEDLELIRRIPRVNPKTGKPLSTFYILGLNFDNPPYVENAVSQNETRGKRGRRENKDGVHVSNCDSAPCLNNGQARVSKNAETVCQNETLTFVREPVREPCAASAAHQDFDFGSFFDRVWRASPRPDSWSETEAAVEALIEAGERPGDILAATESYRARVAGHDASRIKYSQNFYADGSWKRHVPTAAPKATQEQILAARAQNILEAKPFVCRHISAHAARECVTAGLVTSDQCHAAGISV
ncbi:helix-turn-helix domain-containing protein [Pseudophaeobacter sp.]|uniref:helix-turn-helix domain-containing protein n=1 Tax=Pseudophaeobacter sp. TaxID=1971739 RepID=UPI003A97A328